MRVLLVIGLVLALVGTAEAKPRLSMHDGKVAIKRWAYTHASATHYREFAVVDCQRRSRAKIRCAVIGFEPTDTPSPYSDSERWQPLTPADETYFPSFTAQRRPARVAVRGTF